MSATELGPRAESEHAYVRFADGAVYVCPWQIEFRCRLASADAGRGVGGGHRGSGSRTAGSGHIRRHSAELGGGLGPEHGWGMRPFILSSGWTVPLAWFVPFSGAERWIALGRECRQERIREDARYCRQCPAVDVGATAQAGRTLLYVTSMAQARQRVRRGVAAFRALADCLRAEPGHAGQEPGNVFQPPGYVPQEPPGHVPQPPGHVLQRPATCLRSPVASIKRLATGGRSARTAEGGLASGERSLTTCARCVTTCETN